MGKTDSEIRVSCQLVKNIIIRISDQGKGIDEKVKSHIFEPFFSTKRSKEGNGLGLGLSISQDLIKGMKGKITFSSQPDVGTTFTIKIPVRVGN